MNWIELVGFCGTGLTLAAWAMKSSLSLRVVGIASSVAFLSYGALTQSWPMIATELMLLPLNLFRLWQLLVLRRAARNAGNGNEWLLPHATREKIAPGMPVLTMGEQAGWLTLLLDGNIAGSTGGIIGDARPFERVREHRTLVAEGEVVVARINLARLEALALETPVLCQRLTRLALERMRIEPKSAEILQISSQRVRKAA